MMPCRRMIFCLVCLLAQGLSLLAQTDAIEPGSIIEATLASHETHRYQLRALKLTLISFRVEALAAGFDPVLEVFDSSGKLIVSNDDYAYPDVLDAIIQAFIIPLTDTYTVQVSGFDGTGGGYRLLLLPGYDSLAWQDRTMAQSDWEVVYSETAVVQPSDGGLVLEMEGASKSASLVGRHLPTERDFYFEAAFDNVVSAPNGQVGILFRYLSPERYYRLLLNKRGYWRMERVEGAETVTVRNWNTHPAIAPGETDFRLGVLASGQLFDIVYNGQVVGTVIENRIVEAGGVGITTTTDDSFGSRLSFVVREATMTLPTRVDGDLLFPQQLVAGSYTALANSLARQQMIPATGEVKLTLPKSTVRDIPPGVTRFPVGFGITFAEFVIGMTLSYETRASAAGCGIIFHYADEKNYTLAYINAAGEYGVSRRQGDAFQPGIYGSNLTPAQKSQSLLVIVYDGMLHYYINYLHVGTMPYQPLSGELGIAVVNFEQADTTCVFENLWLWSLDEAAS